MNPIQSTNHNYSEIPNTFEELLARWTPQGKPPLHFLLTNGMEKEIRYVLQKAEQTIYFEREELKNFIYKIFETMNPNHTEASYYRFNKNFRYNISTAHTLFQFVNDCSLQYETLVLDLLHPSEIQSSQIFLWWKKIILNGLINGQIVQHYGDYIGKIPSEAEEFRIGADKSLKKMIGIPFDFRYQNADKDPFTEKNKKSIAREVKSRFDKISTEEIFRKYIETVPKFQKDKKALQETIEQMDADDDAKYIEYKDGMAYLLKRYANDLYDSEEQKINDEIDHVLDTIKNAAQTS